MSEVVGEAIVKFKADTTGVNPAKEGEKAGKDYSKGVLSSTKRLAAGLAGAFVVQKVGGFLADSVKGAIEDQASQRKLAVALKNTTGATKEQDSAVESWISKMEVAKGVTDNDLRAGLQRLVQATGSVSKAQKLMGVSLDASAATGKSLTAVTAAVAKAQNGNVASLARLGVVTTKQTANTQAAKTAQLDLRTAQEGYDAAVKKSGPNSLAAQTAANKLALAHQKLKASQGAVTKTTLSTSEVMGKMASTFHGQAEARAQSLQGRMDRLHIILDETKETIGYKLMPVVEKFSGWLLKKGIPGAERLGGSLKNELLPPVESVVDTVRHALPALEAFGKFLLSHRSIIIAVVAAWVAWRTAVLINNAVQAISLLRLKLQTAGTVENTIVTYAASAAQKAWAAAQWLLNAAMDANPIGLLIIGVAALVGGVILAYKHSETFREVIGKLGDAFTWLYEHAVKPVLGFLLDHWKLIAIVVATLIGGPIIGALVLLATHFGLVKDAVHVVGQAFTWLWNNAIQPVVHFILEAFGKVLGVFATMVSAFTHVPGAGILFPWAGDLSKMLKGASDKANGLADDLKKIPTHKTVNIDVVTRTDAHGVVHAAGGHVPALADGGVVRARPGGTLVRVGEAGSDEAVVPLGRDSRTAGAGAGIYVAGDYVVQAHNYDDLTQKQRRQVQVAAFAGRQPAGASR